jgi:hypothetical protein
MTEPEEALEQARREATRMRAAGGYPEQARRAEPPEPDATKLWEWAVIDPELENVRSLRRYGAPVTALKRGLLRLLAQYHTELNAQQTRFNVRLLEELRALQSRVEAIERRLDERDR